MSVTLVVLVVVAVVDVLVVGVLAWWLRRAERTQTLAQAESQAVLARLRAELGDLVADAERRTRALDEALAMREATLRVLLQTAAPCESRETPSVDPAEVRLLRELELSLERRETDAEAGR
jgi:hypothetical protein